MKEAGCCMPFVLLIGLTPEMLPVTDKESKLWHLLYSSIHSREIAVNVAFKIQSLKTECLGYSKVNKFLQQSGNSRGNLMLAY